jgi:hypothetical protein
VKIVIGNNRVAKRTGTEIVTRDFALGLWRRGHEVAVLTLDRGPFAQEIISQGVPVVLASEGTLPRPDIIHLNQASMVLPAASLFPSVPIVLQCHAPAESLGAEVRHPAVLRRYGISTACCQLLEQALGNAEQVDGILGNYVDLSRFDPRQELPARPRKWLAVCEKKHGLRLLFRLWLLSLWNNARLTAVGPRVKRRIDNVPAEAAQHDLVFASARCALEAAASGAAVVVVDYRGLAGMLSTANHAQWVGNNLGIDLLTFPTSLSALQAALRCYNPQDAQAVSRLVRQQTDLESGLDRLESIYRSVLGGG